MSERKSINKYYPPDYDPSKDKQKRKPKNGSIPTVRLMLPFSIKCLHCDEYMAHRRKFNAKKETTAENYLGIKIILFTFRCPKCYAHLSFKTDPKNGDFECVSGCKKNYEKPKTIKSNESIEEMIERLEKEALEDAKLNEKGKNKDVVTGVEELERRMIQQQKERAMMDEIEMLQGNSDIIRTKGLEIEKKLDLKELEGLKDEQETKLAFGKKTNSTNYVLSAASDEIFNKLMNKKKQGVLNTREETEAKSGTKTIAEESRTHGISLGYESSTDGEESDESTEPPAKKQKHK